MKWMSIWQVNNFNTIMFNNKYLFRIINIFENIHLSSFACFIHNMYMYKLTFSFSTVDSLLSFHQVAKKLQKYWKMETYQLNIEQREHFARRPSLFSLSRTSTLLRVGQQIAIDVTSSKRIIRVKAKKLLRLVSVQLCPLRPLVAY